jgi:hypothetical protein
VFGELAECYHFCILRIAIEMFMILYNLVVGKSTEYYHVMYFLGKCDVMKEGDVRYQIMVLFLFFSVFSKFFEFYPEQ